ncbi:small secreted protein [Laccaria bicolor S238N-H82]|uniref:Small secreted protein n=1 Tax=Laccaria bicolor (strain S238N-H82 / ATCC MYA-4686) TaxID=486041 RepID=B0D2U1_LACBS|nr:small secreted protein [Laccaria bicolor S238N-H82]EDR10810.1 small secreted protein [Laccaria bicolor S238N-H82]|eukprot:XP_001878111.1 small secreted protein [Laccaria bicolor S238N-H82]
MKNLFFIALTAVIVHATATIRSDRIDSFQASDPSDGLAHRRGVANCADCDSGPATPYCLKCLDTLFGGCINTHGQTCDYAGALTSDKSCGTGSWGCVDKCCPKKCN